jgi:hypothetical protein
VSAAKLATGVPLPGEPENSVKVTVPVGVPDAPDTVAESVDDKPVTVGVVPRLAVCGAIVNGSAVPVVIAE